MDKRAIGVFDSGLGGLTVLKEIKEKLPNENTIYFGDTARVPYGSKTRQQVLSYTMEAIEFFISKNVKAIVIACNTATVSALEEVRQKYDVPIIGVVEPGARAVSRVSKNKEVLVLATEGTVKSGVYEEKILKQDKSINVVSKSCPAFVSLVENGMCGTSVAYGVVNSSLKEFKGKDIDAIVLGCTHYPYLRKEISEVMGNEVMLVNPAIETVLELKRLLRKGKILNLNNSVGKSVFYVSSNPQGFKENAQNLMGMKINEVGKINSDNKKCRKKA